MKRPKRRYRSPTPPPARPVMFEMPGGALVATVCEPDGRLPNYIPEQVRQTRALLEAGVIKKGELTESFIYHDSWCNVQKGPYVCNCNPDVKVTRINPEAN